MADAWAQMLRDRGRRVSFCWKTFRERTLEAMPPLSAATRRWMHRAVRIAPFHVWKRRISKYNTKSAYGPNLATNAHLRVASDEELLVIYEGQKAIAQGDASLAPDQLLAFGHLLFKSQDPLIADRWRFLLIQAVDYKW
eukprot:gene11469-23376_t